jgi:hypothetical protein
MVEGMSSIPLVCIEDGPGEEEGFRKSHSLSEVGGFVVVPGAFKGVTAGVRTFFSEIVISW